MLSSCALHKVKALGEGILGIRGHLTLPHAGPISENSLPLGLNLTLTFETIYMIFNVCVYIYKVAG
jgi:hypothetical protein